MGQGGIVECNGVQVSRIDQKIPEFVNEINQSNFHKCFADRYLQEYQTWTLYPSVESDVSDEVLVLNEQEGSWSIYDLPLSCLGTVDSSKDPTWEDYQAFNGDPSATLPPYVWVATVPQQDFQEQKWISGNLQAGYPLFIGGGHNGLIYQLDVTDDDLGGPISMVIESANWNPYKEQGIGAQMGYIDFFIDSDPMTKIKIEFFVNNESAPYRSQWLNFVPQENFVGDIDDISTTNPVVVSIHNHNLDAGNKINLYHIEGIPELNGATYTITRIDDDTFSLDGIDGTLYEPYLGSGIAVKGPYGGMKVWKRVFAGAIGYGHSIKITNQANDEPVRIHAIMPWFRAAGNRMITL